MDERNRGGGSTEEEYRLQRNIVKAMTDAALAQRLRIMANEPTAFSRLAKEATYREAALRLLEGE